MFFSQNLLVIGRKFKLLVTVMVSWNMKKKI